MVQEPIEGTVVEQPQEGAAPLPAVIPIQRRELINVEQAIDEWERYQELTKRLLDDTDYQKIGKQRFKKKSAWRKYARAFNISCAVVSQEVARAEDGFPLFARVVVRATEPGGRWQDADQECHVQERCCPGAGSGACTKVRFQWHDCCERGCDGRLHFSHPGDLPATALTRAKNRAISDLIGAGEVSAEEMDRVSPEDPPPLAAKPTKKSAAPSYAESHDAAQAATGAPMSDNQRKAIRASLGDLFGKDEKAAFEWMEKNQKKAAQGTAIHLTGLSTAEAAKVIKALKDAIDERDSRAAGDAQE
jgi:hypothetical protein